MTDQPDDIPIRQTAIALTRQWVDDISHWLVVDDPAVEYFQMIEADRLEGESFRESIDREFAWQLNLRRRKDYIVSSVPRLHLAVPIAVEHGCSDSESQHIEVVEFYLIELYGRAGRKTLKENERVKWKSTPMLFDEELPRALESRQRQLLVVADILREDYSHE